MNITIEKDVPAPTKAQVRGNTTRQMEVGDSVFLQELKDVHNLRQVLYKRKQTACMRKVDGGYRVWRLA